MKEYEQPLVLNHFLQLYHKYETNIPGPVISEQYDEVIFNTSGPIIDILQAHKMASKPISHLFTPEFESKELANILETNERIMAECDSKKIALLKLEEDLRQLQAEKRLENE